MCGIIGFTGYTEAKKVLIDGLTALEYRGYDSAGIAFYQQGSIKTIKTTGKVSILADKVAALKIPDEEGSSCGIGHTRWATHGGVTDTNAHPHTAGKVTLIHNGIIENYRELEIRLKEEGKTPVSQTDTEIAALLLDSLYEGDALKAIRQAVELIEGAYAFCIIFADQPEVIYSLRNSSPLVACHAKEGSIIASDMVALIDYSKDYFVVPEMHVVTLTKKKITLTDLDGNQVCPRMLHVNWDMTAAQKGGYPHFMLKEIHEQPDSLRNTILPRIQNKLPDFTADNIPDSLFDGITRIVITACGTAMHAGLIGRAMLEKLLRLPVTVEVASEFRYQDPIIEKNTLVITISQSGETADTLAALKLSRERGASTLSIVNVKGSSIARESDYVLYTHAGPEIAVASTKAYTAQLACLYLLAFRFGFATGKLEKEVCMDEMQQLLSIIPAVEETLAQDKVIEEISKQLTEKEDLFFIGRGLDYALSCEGSIKLKEISYIHSEAYAAGELKHGTLSLVTEGVPVVALATQQKVYSKMISNIREVKARNAFVILITIDGQEAEPSIYDYHIALPEIKDDYAPFLAAVVLQLLAYYTSLHRGLNVDQPRNLAKSVTVE